MNAPIRILTSLRNAPSAPMSTEEFNRLRSQAWTERGVIVITPDEISDDWIRQGAIQQATKLFGKRMKRGK